MATTSDPVPLGVLERVTIPLDVHSDHKAMPTTADSTVKRKFSIEEVAEALDITPRTVRNRIKDGELPAIQPGREYIITRTDLVEWLGSEGRVDDIFGSTKTEKEA